MNHNEIIDLIASNVMDFVEDEPFYFIDEEELKEVLHYEFEIDADVTGIDLEALNEKIIAVQEEEFINRRVCKAEYAL